MAGQSLPLLLASPHQNGEGPVVFGDREVEGIRAFARVIGPTLRSWMLLGRLKLSLHEEG
jgi:hypothetical protein